VVDRRTALSLLLAVLAVAALAVSAATLDSTTTTRSGSAGGGTQPGQVGFGDAPESGVDIGGEAGGGPGSANVCVEELRSPVAQFGAVVIALVGFLLLYRQIGSAVIAGLALTSLGFPFLFIWGLLISCGQTNTQSDDSDYGFGETNETGLMDGGGAPGFAGSGEAVTTPTAALGLLLVVAIAGSVVLLVRSAAAVDQTDEPTESDTSVAEPASAVGTVAGQAADRLADDADVSNEVYRAWREMTTYLDVDHPRASTPAEFAAAAVDAGMAREDVTELTAVFEAVRYGPGSVTDDQERRAREALRNIEETYSDDTEGGVDE
jgi:hypothetical protein